MTLAKGAKKLESAAPEMPAIHNEIGKTHTVEIHPHIDPLLNVKGFIKESGKDHVQLGDIKKAGIAKHIINHIPRDAHGKVTEDMIDKHIAWLPKKKVNVQVMPYTWGSQQHRALSEGGQGAHQYVASVQLHPEHHDKAHPDTKALWNDIKANQHNFDVDNIHGDDKHNNQFGWARIDPYRADIKDTPGVGSGKRWDVSPHNHWHVDEIQSDFQNKDKVDKFANRQQFPEEDADTARFGDFQKWHGSSNIADDENHSEEIKAHPAYDKLKKLDRERAKQISAYYDDAASEKGKAAKEKANQAKKDMFALAEKHGIVKPHKEYLDEANKKIAEKQKLGSKSKELLEHISHGHDDPQHAIHSAVNALGRKLGTKSVSMDTPKDQAEQSGLRQGPSFTDPDGDHRSDWIDERIGNLKEQYHEDRWKDPKTKDLIEENSKNPNFKSALNKIGGLDKLEALTGTQGLRNGAIEDNELQDDVGNKHPDLLNSIKKLSTPEKDAINDFMKNYEEWLHEDAVDHLNDQYQEQFGGTGDEAEIPNEDYDKEPFNLSDLPVHQQQTYYKRPKKLGMKEVNKEDVLGVDPDDKAKKVQYMKLHKKLQTIRDLVKQYKDSVQPLNKSDNTYKGVYHAVGQGPQTNFLNPKDLGSSQAHMLEHYKTNKLPIRNMVNPSTGKQEPHLLMERGMTDEQTWKPNATGPNMLDWSTDPNNITTSHHTVMGSSDFRDPKDKRVAGYADNSPKGVSLQFWVPQSHIVGGREYLATNHLPDSNKSKEDEVSHGNDHILIRPGKFPIHSKTHYRNDKKLSTKIE